MPNIEMPPTKDTAMTAALEKWKTENSVIGAGKLLDRIFEAGYKACLNGAPKLDKGMLTKCNKCGETYGRHRSAMCRIDDKVHEWVTTGEPNIEMSAEEAEMPPDEERQAIEILDALGDEISAKAVWLAARSFYHPRVSELEAALRTSIEHFTNHNCPKDEMSDEPCDICALLSFWSKALDARGKE